MGEAADVVRRLYAAIEREDAVEIAEFWSDDVEWDMSRAPGGSVVRGRDNVLPEWRRWRGAWETYDVEVEEIIERGDQVLGLIHVTAKSRGAGVDIDADTADLYTVEDGKVVEFTVYFDRDDARREAGF